MKNFKKTLINPANVVKPISGYSHAVSVEIGDASLIFITGQIAIDMERKVVAPNDAKAQTEYIFNEIKNILEASHSSLNDIVKVTIFVTSMADFSAVAEVRNRVLANILPASTFVEVNKLVTEGCIVEIEAVAVTSR